MQAKANGALVECADLYLKVYRRKNGVTVTPCAQENIVSTIRIKFQCILCLYCLWCVICYLVLMGKRTEQDRRTFKSKGHATTRRAWQYQWSPLVQRQCICSSVWSRAPWTCAWGRIQNHPIWKKCHKRFTVHLNSIIVNHNDPKGFRVGEHQLNNQGVTSPSTRPACPIRSKAPRTIATSRSKAPTTIGRSDDAHECNVRPTQQWYTIFGSVSGTKQMLFSKTY